MVEIFKMEGIVKSQPPSPKIYPISTYVAESNRVYFLQWVEGISPEKYEGKFINLILL